MAAQSAQTFESVGKFVTLLNYETIDPEGNQFYSHSFLFAFSAPFTQTGIIEKEMPMPISKVMVICKSCNKPVRVGFLIRNNGGGTSYAFGHWNKIAQGVAAIYVPALEKPEPATTK